ncbi:DNA helicase/exodeoxyribonuclease V, subunit A [Cribrihabitans marinus]|uniref:DNA 3'-5' helicase n=1 Tax=Cribrihabitans marinus TaxID=1227549 RepID=A0A1H6YU22_9RHOB|nr:double-strand break repair helicase AddA [Cribrihabitans marinus]GGH29264.1 double-strand break repair helicase AddA [Cribrihabitans marinus]SEJ40782.1 DNA helicase/exodeoxyribonuclease V, subunit A [Cribrihabitans marinus]
MTPRDDASARQVQAARPDASTWLAANAGSGKTRVLTDRVARLLLDGVDPQRILCLTYTKAAASEMQNRLFRRLGEWAMLDDAALHAALTDLGVPGGIDARRLAQARTLFARAIETPGGLKIQTIHSFCATLLRRFPLEAQVSPQFVEIEDRAAALLRQEIVEEMADGADASLIEAVAGFVTDTDFDKLTRAMTGRREGFDTPLGWADLLRLFDLPDGFDEPALLGEVFLGGEIELLREIGPTLAESGGNNAKAAARLDEVTAPDLAGLAILEGVLLTGPGAKEPFAAKIGSFPTKALREGALARKMPQLEALMARVEAARNRRLELAAARKSHALHRFAAVFLPEYARRKQLRGWLDFDDLILKARALLTTPSVAAWVLYRLDGGIDHILVDEAQDTSPAQWDVIERLAQEFTSGQGARADVERTIFVVGDKKQSIYSFQGADPEAFDRMQREFGRRLSDSGSDLQDLTLEYSFRSSEAILRLVDLVFAGQDGAGFHKEAQHRAFKSDMPGRVDLWPVVEKVAEDEDGDWTDPVDRPGARHHTVILAETVARSIKEMIARGDTVPVDGPDGSARRPVRPGDIMILVQRRSDLFAEIIRACKSAGLPIAGADRLKVGAELAVKDLAALLSFLATPEDDLSLACALKSPLFGWSERQLFDLAHHRAPGEYLWTALRRHGGNHADTLATLRDLRGQTDFLRPYDLIERILTRHDGRRRLLGRLGNEAEDGINALLSQALGYERSDVPSLTGFLSWMQTDDLEIKRQMSGVGDMIRVMTVHGAKGLESPVVILPDTAKPAPHRDAEILVADGTPLWRVAKDDSPPLISEARAAARQRQEEERLRLLYVALTRAETWLIVAAAGDLGGAGDSWYDRVAAGMEPAGATRMENGVLRLEHGDWTAAPVIDLRPNPDRSDSLPDMFRTPAARPAARPDTLSPSDLGGAKALPGDAGQDETAALARGTRLHLLLELLPGRAEADWPVIARHGLPDLPETERAALLAEVSAVLSAPDLAAIFAAGALAEVAVSADLGPRRLHGVIDRLIVSPDRVLAVDFKTNATVPDTPEACPDGLLRQMGAYAQALGQIYPDRRIDTAILWTRTARLMPLPHDLVTRALAASQIS